MSKELFRDDAYLQSCEATVTDVNEAGVVLDRTVFYPMGGGQPGDQGWLVLANGLEIAVMDTRHDKQSGNIVHVLADGETPPAVGEKLTCRIDWDRRYRLMRMHSALHMLCSVIDGGVTGGQIGVDKSRLDFDLENTALDKEAIQQALNDLVAEDHALTVSSITDEELAQNPDLVRTMSVRPPTGAGRVRTVAFGDVDYQPCGGTHVNKTSEIGRLRVGKIENKGKHNRRVNIHLED